MFWHEINMRMIFFTEPISIFLMTRRCITSPTNLMDTSLSMIEVVDILIHVSVEKED